MSVKRYEVNGSSSVFEDENGSLVDYEDYAALAAENAALKSAVTQQIELRAEMKKAGRAPHADFWVQSICEAEEKVKRALKDTTATDAYLAEVRAQGVDMAACALDVVNQFNYANMLDELAQKIRKGVQS